MLSRGALALAAGASAAAAWVAVRLRRQHLLAQQRVASDADAKCAHLQAELQNQSAALTARIRQLEQILESRDEGDGSGKTPLYRIVLTGGPCAGKTSALSEVKARLEALGFLVLCVPENATLLFGGGVPFPSDEASAFTLQKNLLNMQMAIEDAFINIAEQSGRPTVILLDRGTMDGKAYMSEQQWELMLEELRYTPVALRDQRYDAIVHLVTAADGADRFYTLANNSTRTESAEQAIAMDRRTLECWTGHEHLYIVDNSTGFDEKIRRCVARISKLVGVPAPLALTRKFLLRKKPTIDEITMHVSTTEVFEVEQTYLLCLRKAERCRIRRRQQGCNVSFQHQLWCTKLDERSGEAVTTCMERTLTAREYHMLMKQADPSLSTVTKTLACFTWGNAYWELNSFNGAQHVAILEVETETPDGNLNFPPMMQLLREVTNESSYDSYTVASEMAKSGFAPPGEKTPATSPYFKARSMSDVLHALERRASSFSSTLLPRSMDDDGSRTDIFASVESTPFASVNNSRNNSLNNSLGESPRESVAASPSQRSSTPLPKS